MIEIKISDVDIFELSKLNEKLKDHNAITCKHLPVTDSKGNVIACDSHFGDIAIQVLGVINDIATEVAIGLLVDWLKELIQDNAVGFFFTIGSTKISKDQLTKEEIREIVKEELEKKSQENSES